MTGFRIMDSGVGTLIQDRGRPGWRRFGVSLSGALDPFWLGAANLLVGNDPAAAGLEILLRGPSLVVLDQPVCIALVGNVGATLTRNDTEQPLPLWQGVRLRPGDRVKVGAPQPGIAYLAVSGGVTNFLTLGSSAQDRRLGMSVGLSADHALPAGPAGPCFRQRPYAHPTGPVGLILGPQDDHFLPESLEHLVNTTYRVGPQSDRMGARLEGIPLRHSAKGPEIVTDCVTPGAIQVAADGRPILLRQDAQTTGGYAKVAVAVTADLPRIGHLRPGDSVTFRWRRRDQALSDLDEQRRNFARWCEGLRPAEGKLDVSALYHDNLISGVVSGGEA